MDRRVDHLVAEGLARRQGQRIVFARDLLNTLRRRELDAASSSSSARPDCRIGRPPKASTSQASIVNGSHWHPAASP